MDNITIIRELLANGQGVHDLTSLPGQVKMTQMGELTLEHVHSTEGQFGCFALIAINNTQDAYQRGGSESHSKCWHRLAEIIQGQLPDNAYAGYVSLGIAIHSWGDKSYAGSFSSLLQTIVAKINHTPVTYKLGEDAYAISVVANCGYLVAPSKGNENLSFADVSQRVATTTLAANYTDEAHPIRKFDPIFMMQARRRRAVSHALKRAVIEADFSMEYQPLFDVKTSKMVGVEALVRWNHELLGKISPSEFVPLLEESSLLVEFTKQTIEMCVAFLADLGDNLSPDFTCSLNLSRWVFEWGEFSIFDAVQSTLERYKISPEHLIIEVSETAYFNEEQTDKAIMQMRLLQNLGVQIAIDDYGTGYGSLYLVTGKLASIIKLHPSLTEALAEDSGFDDFIGFLLFAVKAHKLTLVATGVETQQQELMLKKHGITIVQGHRYCEPIHRAHILRILTDVEHSLHG